MFSTRWEEIKRVFQAALLREETEREAFVAGYCGADLELAQQVHRLLRADRASSKFLEEPVVPKAFTLPAEPTEVLLEPDDLLCHRFKIVSYLGAGGMGQVYKAIDLELRQHLALKAIRPEIATNPAVLSRFKREVQATRRVTHSNVCRTFDLETHTPSEADADRFPFPITFLTMELLEGETIAEHLHRKGRLASSQFPAFARQVALAVQAAHTSGVVHCDLKPSNIFITGREDHPRFVVTDFGIAKFIHPPEHGATSITTSTPGGGRGAGTPFYMAPEQLEGAPSSVASDIYAYGLVLYEALTGQKLSVDCRSRHDVQAALDQFYLTSAADAIWAAIIARCLEHDPAERYTDLEQVLDLLEQPAADVVAIARHRPAVFPGPRIAPQVIDHAPDRQRMVARSRRFLVLAALVVCAAIMWVWIVQRNKDHTPARTGPADLSVAVLPVLDRENSPHTTQLAEHITLALTSDLAQVSGIRVPSQTLIRSLGSAPDLASVRRALNVDRVVTGFVMKDGEDSELHLELVDAGSGSELWSHSYRGKVIESSSLHEDISLEIAYKLRARKENADNRSAGQGSTNGSAQQAYAQGQAALAEHTYAGFERAAKLFLQAIDADLTYAPPMAELARCYMAMAINNNRPEPPLALMSQAEYFARRALRLDSGLPAAYTALAQVQLLRDYNWTEAEENFKRAEELDPDYVPSHVSHALHLLTAQGRFAEARAQFTYANRERPRTLGIGLSEALGSYFSRRYESSLEQLNTLEAQFHSTDVALEMKAQDYIALGYPEKALNILNQTPPDFSVSPSLKRTLIAIALARMGQRNKADAELRMLEKAKEQNFNFNYHLAALCGELGYRNKALKYLERSQQDRQTSILFVGVDPLMDSLRSDPGFRALMLRLGLG